MSEKLYLEMRVVADGIGERRYCFIGDEKMAQLMKDKGIVGEILRDMSKEIERIAAS